MKKSVHQKRLSEKLETPIFVWKSKALNLDSMPLWVLALLMLDPPAVERCLGRHGWLRGMATLRHSTAAFLRTKCVKMLRDFFRYQAGLGFLMS